MKKKQTKKDIINAIECMIPTALLRVENILHSTDDEKLILEIYKTLLDRAYGKPKQEVEQTNYNLDMTLEETKEKINEYINKCKGE